LSAWWQPKGPSVASGGRVPGVFGAGMACSGRCGQSPESGVDLGEQVVSRWQAQDEHAGVADEPGWNCDQPMPKSE